MTLQRCLLLVKLEWWCYIPYAEAVSIQYGSVTDGLTDKIAIYIYISRALKTKCRTPTISMKARVKWNAKNTPCTKLINIAGICRYSVAEFRDHPQNFSNSYAIFFIAFSCANTAIVCFSFVRVRLICDLNNSDYAIIMPLQPMLQRRHYVFALFVPASVLWTGYFFRFAKTLNTFGIYVAPLCIEPVTAYRHRV